MVKEWFGQSFNKLARKGEVQIEIDPVVMKMIDWVRYRVLRGLPRTIFHELIVEICCRWLRFALALPSFGGKVCLLWSGIFQPNMV